MSLVECPEPGCTVPAEIVDRAVLGSCTGPVPHVRTVCMSRHWFFMPADRVVPLPAAPRRSVSRRG
jgi:hypothetical protein